MTATTRLRTIARIAAAAVATGAVAVGIAVGVAAPASAGAAAPFTPKYCTIGFGGPNSDVDRQAVLTDASELQLYNRINTLREANLLPRLQLDVRLQRPAAWASWDNVVKHRTSPPSDHVDSNHRGVAERVKSCAGLTGEFKELSFEAFGDQASTPEKVLTAWFASPSGRNVLLDRNAKSIAIGQSGELSPGGQFKKHFWTAVIGY